MGDDDGDDVVPSSVPAGGRGRGRGGGVPVLPTGVWAGLQSTTTTTTDINVDRFVDRVEGDGGNRGGGGDAASAPAMPMGFGRGRGRGGGGRLGMQRDAKGPDWDCPQCQNTNWSWREECNQCKTKKPTSLLTVDARRDGAGGGFNERQEKASTAAALVVGEDGFDDYGRRIDDKVRAA